MIDFGTLENHRVITQSLNHAEWDLVRAFVRKLDSNDIWMRFGRPLDLQQDVILKQFFDVRAGTGEIMWSPDEHGAIAGLLHRIRVSSSEAALGRTADRRWNRPATAYRWPGSSLRNHPHRTQSPGGGMPEHRFV